MRKYYKNPAITTDVIVGFPGEKEDELNKEQVQEKNLATQLKEKAGVRERYRFSEQISPTLPQPTVGDVEMVKIGVEDFVGEVMKEFDEFN